MLGAKHQSRRERGCSKARHGGEAERGRIEKMAKALVGAGGEGMGCSWLQAGSGSPMGSEQSWSRSPDLFSVAPCCRDGQ